MLRRQKGQCENPIIFQVHLPRQGFSPRWIWLNHLMEIKGPWVMCHNPATHFYLTNFACLFKSFQFSTLHFPHFQRSLLPLGKFWGLFPRPVPERSSYVASFTRGILLSLRIHMLALGQRLGHLPVKVIGLKTPEDFRSLRYFHASFHFHISPLFLSLLFSFLARGPPRL